MRSSGVLTPIDRIPCSHAPRHDEMEHDCVMSAHRRFVLGARLLVVAVCLIVAGRVVWSRVDTRHVHNGTAATMCPTTPTDASSPIQAQLLPGGHVSAQITFGTSDACAVYVASSESSTTPNRVPGLALVALG